MAGLEIFISKVPKLHGAVALALLWLNHLFICVAASKSVYFDKYGDCQRPVPFDLADEEYELKPVGGGIVHENRYCEITFKAPLDHGICLTFKEFYIDDCRVKLKVYSSDQASGTAWRTLECSDSRPGQMCTANRFVTVQVAKETLVNNRGYYFEIHIEKSNSVTEEGVLFASIGVFVGIILGVVLLIVVLAITVVYCCCKWRRKQKRKVVESAGSAAAQENSTLVQPSAPPPDLDDHPWAPHHESHLYPHLPYGPYGPPPEHPPPPYVPPPPYNEDNAQPAPNSTIDVEQTHPVKQ